MKRFSLLFRKTSPVILMLASTCLFAQVSKSSQTNNNRMQIIQNNRARLTELYVDVLNNRKFERLHEFISDDYVSGNNKTGVDAFKEPALAVLKAIPDAQWEIQNLVVDESNAFVHWKVVGINTGAFLVFAPSGKNVVAEGMGIFRLSNGKVISSQVMTDRLGFLQQLGVLPEDITTLSADRISPEAVVFIDKFVIPDGSLTEFTNRLDVNRKMISTMPGFIDDYAYERKDEHGNTIVITVAIWKDEQALQRAKTNVQELYKNEGFNPAAMMQRLNIQMDRATYTFRGLN
ncbi:ester cyclase [Pseudochryseolinea flava]|uniref:ABM domain-containing protein n=1 Tax=Pseudochryseolinea flava TaxID=2059302 RepID=A0A364XY83_9BACT|nr:ester cyclase [Pseudochryseolinea flava]RAV98949.1 hypothetical protein DQQ10_21885 [Pseudochryseolinea flava]